ncbi:MAG: hypothetical protein H6506_03715 [Calditrichaeota bacterium]|nr:hypothetical protein [Calditrichota bacterium]MCB9391740.1 hypothetical protein [Calditrichota bacterium]
MQLVRMMFAFLLVACTSARAGDMPELATLLSLFSANAADDGRIRLNWTLDQQSPTIVKFRIYRGYEEFGNFSVLTEVTFHAELEHADYLYQDTSAIPGVTYYYKLAAQGQLNESIFPVVISAAVPLGVQLGEQVEQDPVLILPGAKLRLYMRKAGHLVVTRTMPEMKTLLDGDLAAGVYEIDSSASKQTLTIKLDGQFEKSVAWPLQ